jgi:hypothetical protein
MVIPPDIYTIVEEYKSQGSEDYRNDPRYRPWRGKALQRKREDLISEGLAHKVFAPTERSVESPVRAVEAIEEPVAEIPPAPESVTEPIVVAEPAVAVQVERPEVNESRMQECLGDSEPIIRGLVPPSITALFEGRSREVRLAVIKEVAKKTMDELAGRYRREDNTVALDQIMRVDFIAALRDLIANRLESNKRFFEDHAFFDERSCEPVAENQVVLHLDKVSKWDPELALEQAAQALVLDALYGRPEEMESKTGDSVIGAAEKRVIQVVAETLRRLKDKKADSIDFSGATQRLAVTDLENIRRVIRAKFEMLK